MIFQVFTKYASVAALTVLLIVAATVPYLYSQLRIARDEAAKWRANHAIQLKDAARREKLLNKIRDHDRILQRDLTAYINELKKLKELDADAKKYLDTRIPDSIIKLHALDSAGQATPRQSDKKPTPDIRSK